MTLMKILIPGKMNRGTSFAARPCGYSSKITYLFLKEPLFNGEGCLHKGQLICRSWQDNGGNVPPGFWELCREGSRGFSAGVSLGPEAAC